MPALASWCLLLQHTYWFLSTCTHILHPLLTFSMIIFLSSWLKFCMPCNYFKQSLPSTPLPLPTSWTCVSAALEPSLSFELLVSSYFQIVATPHPPPHIHPWLPAPGWNPCRGSGETPLFQDRRNKFFRTKDSNPRLCCPPLPQIYQAPNYSRLLPPLVSAPLLPN